MEKCRPEIAWSSRLKCPVGKAAKCSFLPGGAESRVRVTLEIRHVPASPDLLCPPFSHLHGLGPAVHLSENAILKGGGHISPGRFSLGYSSSPDAFMIRMVKLEPERVRGGGRVREG